MLLTCLLAFVLYHGHLASVEACREAVDCYPTGYIEGRINVSDSLINCSAVGECVCNECFLLDKDNSICAVDSPCWAYDTSDSECKDHRRSQVIALVLAAILSAVGAANFYIARYEYAVPQLALFVCLIIASCFGRILRYLSDDKGRKTEKFCALCTTVTAAVVAIIALGVIVAWWIADIVFFSKNARSDGDNCPLRSDL